MPAVSFLMVFHRPGPFLVPAVRSVLTQTFRDLELVLVDNGTGLGLVPLGEWGRDPRIRLVMRPANGGIAAGHVAALAQARGDYFALLDHDDIALPDRIERQVAALRRDPRLGIVSSRVEAIDEQGRVTGSEFVLLDERDQYVYSAFNMPGVTPSYTGRRNVFQRFPYRPEFDCATDYDFFTRAAEAWPLAGVPEVLTQYRHHRGQTLVQKGSQQILAACMIRLLAARRRQGRPEDLAGLAAGFRGWLADPPALAQIYARFSLLALHEGLAPPAVYLARKLLSVRRDPAACARAVRVFLAALRLAPRDAAFLTRLFLTGPVRALSLKRA